MTRTGTRTAVPGVADPDVRGLRLRLRAELNLTVHGGNLHLERYDRPAGDPGLFPAGAVARTVHADLPGMLVGGFAALMTQSLHPLAMAGVVDHSRWREDPIDRLRRTATYVSVTTFASTEVAEAAIAGVRRVHTRVSGTAPDGRPYAAGDPDLLTWVHVAEVSCFLAGYRRYGRTPLDRAARDRYYAETATLAHRLGATEVPADEAGVAAYLRRVRPELRATDAARDTVAYLRRYGENRRQRIAVRVLMDAAAGLLPPWARAELGIRRPAAVRRLVDRPLAALAGRLIRWAVEPSAIVAASDTRQRG